MIYVTGDTHGDMKYFAPERMAFGPEDKVIITGDFGFMLENVRKGQKDLDALEKKPYEILFVPGNHEHYQELAKFPVVERYGAPVRKIRENIYMLLRGEIYTIEGRTFFAFGGAYSIDKDWRMKFQSICGIPIWFPEEMPSKEEYHRGIENLKACGMQVDYVLTHTAPRCVIPQILGMGVNPDAHEQELNGFLNWIYLDGTFKKWYCGHFHVDMSVNDQFVACFEGIYPLGTGPVRPPEEP